MTDHKLTEREKHKHEVITRLIKGEITNDRASRMLGITVRQVQRLKNTVWKDGVAGVVHKLKERPSNHQKPDCLKQKALDTIKILYSDFKPGFATEKLQEQHDIFVTSQTIRIWMMEEGLWKKRRRRNRSEYRSWRPRKAYFGQMQQFDGSYHLWFEDRYRDGSGNNIEVCLLASIDDATGKITHAEFAPHEGVIPVFTFWKKYVLTLGKPQSIYLDKFSTYKINHKSAVDNHELMTQFQRMTKDLDINLITAHSPQAKGRVERLFGTLQDRLVKEMRLSGISDPEEGNAYLKVVFVPSFNAKFAVVPERVGDLHNKLNQSNRKDFNRIFSVQSHRTINLDFTVQFKNNWYQLEEIQPTTVRPKEKVCMEEWLDKTVHISSRGYELNFFQIAERPPKAHKQPTILTTHKLNWVPPKDHPWKKRLFKG